VRVSTDGAACEDSATAIQPRKEKLDVSMVIARKWYSTAEVAEMLGYGLTKTKFLVLSGQIRSVKDGAYRRILPEWVDEYVRRRIEEQAR
jgi:excisionase family DNA binding protein